MHIRDEHPEDTQTIHDLTQAAFATASQSDGNEGPLIDALRANGALSVSLVAEEDGAIKGIGDELIREGLARIEAMGAEGCVLLGHAEYYPRFGFVHDPELTYLGWVTPNFMRLVIMGDPPKGKVAYHPAFGGNRFQHFDSACRFAQPCIASQKSRRVLAKFWQWADRLSV